MNTGEIWEVYPESIFPESISNRSKAEDQDNPHYLDQQRDKADTGRKQGYFVSRKLVAILNQFSNDSLPHYKLLQERHAESVPHNQGFTNLLN